MNQVTDIQIVNYRESLKLTQKSIFFALFLAGFVHYLAYIGEVNELPKLPFFPVAFTSLETLQITLLVLYLSSGFIAWFAISKAFHNLASIKDHDLAISVSKYPCIAVTNIWFGGILAGALLGIGAILLMSIFEFNTIYQKSLYFIVALPFWATLRTGNIIHSWEQKREIQK